MLFDWDSWWAAEMTDGFNRHARYVDTVLGYHKALWNAGAQLDVVPVTADLTGYDVVVAPMLYMLKGDVAARLEEVAARGGTVLSSFWAGRSDEDANAFLADAPGPLGDLFGLRVEETDSAEPGDVNPVHLTGPDGDVTAGGTLVFEVVVPQGAEVVGTYGAEFYAGTPAVTRHPYGDGEAWYVATALDAVGLEHVVRRVLARHDLVGPYADAADVELAVRAKDGQRFAFVLNHALEAREVAAHASGTDLLTGRRIEAGQTLRLEPTDVVVLQED